MSQAGPPMDQAPPLRGVRVVELAGIGPGPHAAQLLGDLGAEVTCVERPGGGLPFVTDRGKRFVRLDLRREGAAEAVLRLCERSDLLIEGFRPGVTERLGLGPDEVHARNPALVYGRMTGWGQTGPWAGLAGHDLNYLGLTGALHAMGEAGRPPLPPLNLVGDYGGGSLFLCLGLLAALTRARATGEGAVVDAAITDGVASMMGVVGSLSALGQWTGERQDNLLDGGAPYYRCYACAGGGYVAVAPIEARFFAQMLAGLGVEPSEYGEQNDRAAWPRQHELLAARFAAKTRDEWAAVFGGTDACVTPVLGYDEAMNHPQNQARGLYAGAPHPAPKVAPVVGEGAAIPPTDRTDQGPAILAELGYSNAEAAALLARLDPAPG